MIFNFLRKYLKDDEFERTKIELAETRQVLKEYKDFILKAQNNQANDEKEKVEPDFIVLMWASVGIAIRLFLDTGNVALELKGKVNEPLFYVWSAIALFAFYFIIMNTINIVKLTQTYAASKSDPSYKTYAWYLTTGVIILGLAILVIGFLN